MKLFISSVLLLAVCLTSESILAKKMSSTVALGEMMPTVAEADAMMTGTDGKKYNINQMKGKEGTLVVFTCNHCPFVVAWQDRLVPTANKYTDKLNVIFINSNDPAGSADKKEVIERDTMEGMQARAKAKGMKFPYVMDETSNVARTFGATKTPEIFLFDKTGKLVYTGAPTTSFKGGTNDEPVLEMAIDQMLAGKKIERNNVKAVGCGIKYREKNS